MADEVKRCVIGVLEGDSTTPCILRSLIRDINYLKKTFVSGSFVIYETTRERSKTDDWKKTLSYPQLGETKNGICEPKEIPCWITRFLLCHVTSYLLAALTRRKSSLYTPQSLVLLHCLRHNLSIMSTCFWILSEITSISSLCLNTSSCCMFVLIYLFCRF